jgi:hypothetical protein
MGWKHIVRLTKETQVRPMNGVSRPGMFWGLPGWMETARLIVLHNGALSPLWCWELPEINLEQVSLALNRFCPAACSAQEWSYRTYRQILGSVVQNICTFTIIHLGTASDISGCMLSLQAMEPDYLGGLFCCIEPVKTTATQCLERDAGSEAAGLSEKHSPRTSRRSHFRPG